MNVKYLLPVLLGIAVLGAVFLSVLDPERIPHATTAGTAHVRAMGAAGWAVFIAVEFLITLVGIIPGSVLGVAAGAVYGVAAGFAAGAVGIFTGALVAFALSRSTLRPMIASVIGRSRRMVALDTLVTKDRWRIVALLRVSPVMPFSLTSYALGLSGISARDYVLGTLASMPPLLGYVVIGALGSSTLNTRGAALIHTTLLVLGAGATLALTVHLSRLLAKALSTTKSSYFFVKK